MKRLFFSIVLSIPILLQAQEYVAFINVPTSYENAREIKSINLANVPFNTKEGMILVDAYVNDTKGTFIIDTGAPSLVLNQQPPTSEEVGRGISQSLKAAPITIKQFNWSNIQKENITAFQVDISHLETVFEKSIAGIIGYDILKEVELLLDYKAQILQIRPAKSEKVNDKQPIAVIPFTMQAHLPVIKVKIGKKKLRLALDTASETNILDKKLYKKLNADLLSQKRVGEIQGVDKEIQKVPYATVQSTNVKDLSFENMPYLFTDLSHLKSESDLFIDGLLGYPFFKNGKMSINYEERKIYVWEKDTEL